MAQEKQPKVLLFDIGGVCVVSPFQAILDSETSLSIPPGWINHCISATKPSGTWQRLERGELLLDTTFFTSFSADLHNPTLWQSFYTSRHPNKPVPPLPKIDAEYLFWEMMRASRDPDPWMYPALKKLKESGKYVIAALSNTSIFPPSHPYATPYPSQDIKSIFDVFISSAHVGLRKPDAAIYTLALSEVSAYAKANAKGHAGWEDGVKANEVLFLDDIGENLKAGKKAGFRTLKVGL
ncbi:Bifunctional epoxide hydrolase, partial [Lachnellula suecica]